MISAYEIDDEVPLRKRSLTTEVEPDEEANKYWKHFYPDLRPVPVKISRKERDS
jgi:hypothetical protein